MLTFAGLVPDAAAADDQRHILVLGRISDDPKTHYEQLKPLLDYVAPRMAAVGIREGRVLMARDAQQITSYLRRGQVDWVTETAGTAMLMQLRGVGRQLALLFADIDDFKRVNDTLGHDVGDEVLIQFANRIREVVERAGGSASELARFGGDEFVILLNGEGVHADIRSSAAHLAETLVAELSRPIVVQDRQVSLDTSIGVTLFPEDASGATMLMKNGDIAMYQAKFAGKNGYRFYSRAMDQAVTRRVRIEQDLRGAWERGELTLMYQPIYRVSDKMLIGAEALLRWQHPVHGQVAPSVFINVAEQSGLIDTIGPAVIRAACKDVMRWRRASANADELFVSVNVSARQLCSGDFSEQVLDALAQSGLPPHGCISN